MRGSCSLGIPIPVSETMTERLLSRAITSSRTLPPEGVYLMALSSTIKTSRRAKRQDPPHLFHRALNGDCGLPRQYEAADNYQHDSEQRGRTERADEPRVLIHDGGSLGDGCCDVRGA